MAIKESEASLKNEKIEYLAERIKDILKSDILKDIPEIKRQIKNILKDVKNVEFNNGEPQVLKGAVLNREEIKELIIEATGYTRWSVAQYELLSKEQIEDYKKNYNIEFEQTDIHNYVYYRSNSNRDMVNMLDVIAFPDCFAVSIHTDSAGYSLDGLVDKKEFLEMVRAETE